MSMMPVGEKIGPGGVLPLNGLPDSSFLDVQSMVEHE
jgi:hypothetical protein